MRSYQDLRIWQLGMAICTEVYNATKSFPDDERFGLRMQIRRAAVSVPSNIAEGWGRNSNAHLRQFCLTARGSLYEVITQVEIAKGLGYLSEKAAEDLLLICDEASASIYRFIESIPERAVREVTAEYRAIQDHVFFEGNLESLVNKHLT